MATRAKPKKAASNQAVAGQKVKISAGEGTLRRPSKGGRQRHVVPAGSDLTLCGLDTGRWMESVEENGEPVTCPHCLRRWKAGQRRPDRELKEETAA